MSRERVYREPPYFVEDEKSLENWENDRYLIDRRQILNQILQCNNNIDIVNLYKKSEVSASCLAKAINELIELSVLIEVDERTLKITDEAKTIILRNRNKFFKPKLSRTWNKIPSDFLNKNSI